MILQSAAWAADALLSMQLQAVEWAVKFRHGTYSAIETVTDKTNPVAARYMRLVRDSGDLVLNEKVNRAVARLHANDIGEVGLFVLMRIRILTEHFVSKGLAHYLPHYSRQPVWLAATDPVFEAKCWTMDQLRMRRPEILQTTEPAEPADPLGRALSPVFIACLARATHPQDVIEQALLLRESSAAREYRAECRDLVEAAQVSGEEVIQRFKLRIAARLKNLNELLFERGDRTEWVRQFDALSVKSWLGWHAPVFRKTSPRQHLGDATAMFLGDVLSQSLGVLNAQRQIQQVFGVEANWDTYIISCATPRVG
jgi:hypothetical protein